MKLEVYYIRCIREGVCCENKRFLVQPAKLCYGVKKSGLRIDQAQCGASESPAFGEDA